MALDIGRRQLAKALHQGAKAPSVIIVGAGFSGLAMAIQLRRSGSDDFVVLEQGDDVGGTWRDNTYPDAGCDAPSFLYSLSFAPNRRWSQRYAKQPEILEYARDCVSRFDLQRHLHLNTTVESATFDETSGQWTVVAHTACERREYRADVVVFGCGQLNRPQFPDIKGLDSFDGPVFHSAQWNHDIELTDKQVACIGNGASAIQFVPVIASQVANLTIFQRSCSYVAPKKDRAYEGRERWLLAHFKLYERLYRWYLFWNLESRWVLLRRDTYLAKKAMGAFHRGLSKLVSDRLPKAAVIPDYDIGCKRILISNDWYPALLRPNVHVVTSAIDHVDHDAVVTADGVRHKADVIIASTGFASTRFLAPITVSGVGATSLEDAWAEGAQAYLGVSVPSFPNCFLLYGPNTNVGNNSIIFMIERQVNLILQGLARIARSSDPSHKVALAPKPAALADQDRRYQALLAKTAWAGTCGSWYKTEGGRITNNWPTWPSRYFWATLRWRDRDMTSTTADISETTTPVSSSS